MCYREAFRSSVICYAVQNRIGVCDGARSRHDDLPFLIPAILIVVKLTVAFWRLFNILGKDVKQCA